MMWERRNRVADKPLLEALEPRLLLAADWTVMVYLDADNNLEGAGIDDVNEMEQVGSTPEVDIVVQFDRTPWYDTTNGNWTDTRRGLIVADNDPAVIATPFSSIGEVNMGSPAALSNFVVWATTTYPAPHYALVIWDHGGGTAGLCVDDTDWDMLTVEEVGVALRTAGVHMDVVAFDACLMGMMEVAHEIASYGDVMVGSEELVPWDGYPYDTVLGDLVGNPTWSAPQLADSMVTRYSQAYGGWGATLSSVDLGAVPALSTEVDDLVDTILAEDADWYNVSAARNASPYFGFSIDNFRDLGAFLNGLAGRATNTNVRQAALDAFTAYNTAILSNYTDPSAGGTGLSIYFPGVGDMIDWYYTPGEFSFLADTSWLDFLNVFCTPVPEITVLDGTTVINDGEVVPIDFGSVLSSTAPVNRTFIIRNDGTGPLSLGTITVPAGFTLVPPAWTTLAPGLSAPFMLTLDTAVPGIFGGDVTIANSDSDENPFNFAVSGEVRASGEITVLYQGSAITDGETVPLDFGQVAQYDATVEHVFTIRNDGPDVLAIATVEVPAGYIVTQPGNTLLAPGETTTFGVTLNTDTMGVHAGEVTFLNSDQDETPFNFAITGTVYGPDLTVADVKYNPGLYATGKDPIWLNTSLSNVGMVAFPESGPVQIQARLSTDTIWGNADDLIVYQGDHHLLDLAVGEQSRWYGQALRTSFGSPPTGSYYVAVKVNNDSGLDEMDLNNNVWWSADADVELYPSNLYTRMTNASKVTFEDDAGQRVTVSFSGPGYADIRTTNGLTQRYMSGDIQRIVFGGTTEKSQLKIATRGDGTRVGDIVVRGPLKAITGKGVTLTGDIEISGSISKIVLGDVAEEHTITIGAPAPGDTKAAVTLLFGSVEETTIISATPIKSLTVTEWLDEDGTPDLIQAPWIGKLTTKGNRRNGVLGHFQADLLLDGVGAGKATLDAVKIAGDLRQADWDITGNMGKLTVIGTAADSTIRTTGGMAGITLGAADGTDFLAGIKDTVARRASDSAHFDSVSASIGSFKIKGLKDRGATRWYFQNSNLSAAKIGKVDLLNVDFDNAGMRFGVYALRAPVGGGIRSVRYADTVTGEKWSSPIGDDLVTAIPDLEIVLL